MLEHSFIMNCLWYVLSFEAGVLVNFITGYQLSFQALVKYYQNRPWCDRVKPSFATHMAFYLPLLLGFQTWNETRLVKDCSFTTSLFIGVLAVIHFLGPRLTFCVIAAACSATSSSGFCFLNHQPGYTF